MANTFFVAQGYMLAVRWWKAEALKPLKRCWLNADKADIAGRLRDCPEFKADAEARVVPVDEVPDGWMILDIGPATVAHFANRLAAAKTVVWNGPMGVFEFPKFAEGTFAVAKALASLDDATTIIGGGDSASAAEKSGLAEK
jgi:phosphoglycerate kinase